VTTDTLITICIAILVGAATIAFAARSIATQLRVIAFLEFTRRYSEIIVQMPTAARALKDDVSLSSLPQSERAATLNAFRLYFNLCSEEFYLSEEKVLRKPTWRIWRRELSTYLRTQIARDAWTEVRGEYYKTFRNEVERILAAAIAQSGDPQ